MPTTPSKSKSKSPKAIKVQEAPPLTSLKKKSTSPLDKVNPEYTSPYSLKSLKKQTISKNEIILLSHRSQGSKGRNSLDSRGSSTGARSDHLSFGNQSKDARFSMTQSIQSTVKTPLTS